MSRRPKCICNEKSRNKLNLFNDLEKQVKRNNQRISFRLFILKSTNGGILNDFPNLILLLREKTFLSSA